TRRSSDLADADLRKFRAVAAPAAEARSRRSAMSSGIGLLGGFLIFSVAVTIFVLLVVFVAVPLFQGIGAVIGATFRGIGWLINHIFEFVGGVFSDAVRFIGSLIAMAVLLPLVPLNIMFGRWSAAGHFAERVKAECQIGAACV